MRKISCIAIDDEPIALLVIKRFCERKGNMELTSFCEPRIGLEEIVRTKPDLVFLDIEMNGLSGLDVAKALPKKCTLVFTTAHAKYALDGFNLDAVDFLHKPIAYERFERAVEKAMLHIKANENEITHDVIQDTIVVKQDYSSINIPISDIFYIEALENYSKIFRLNGGTIISRLNIKAIHKMLPQKQFIRVHRSFVVPVNKIQQFSKQEIHLIGLWKINILNLLSVSIYHSHSDVSPSNQTIKQKKKRASSRSVHFPFAKNFSTLLFLIHLSEDLVCF